MNQDIHEAFEKILKKGNKEAILPFLKDLSDIQKKELVKSIKKHHKYYSEYIQQDNTWSTRGSSEQNQIIGYAAFVCCTGQEYQRLGSSWIKKEEIEEIFEFYVPSWFNTYIHSNLKKDWAIPFWMEYDWMMECYKRGILSPEPQLIVKLLPNFLFDMVEKNKQRVLKRNDNNLLKYPETLNEHIWLFFNHESDIYWVTAYSNLDQGSEEVPSWIGALKDLSDKGKIDRYHLLESCLLGTSMNFNKSLTGWLMNLFIHLEPNDSELISLQSQINGAFSCPHSKVHNTILKYYKQLCTSDSFKVDDFLEQAPVLLSSEIKATVSGTLMVLDKLAKKHKSKTCNICFASAQAFIQTDAAIQKRAAKIIDKYGSEKNEALVAEIANYQDILQTEPKAILANFLHEEEEDIPNVISQNESFVEDKVLDSSNKIILPDTIDDLIFFASQAFDNNEAVHFDVLPSALLKFNNEIKSSQVKGFQPALQRALKLVMGDWRSNIGILDHLLATFFVEYIEVLVQRFPDDANSLVTLLAKYRKEDDENCKQYIHYKRNINTLIAWGTEYKSAIYKVAHRKLLDVLELIKKEHCLPLLSTPTHYPYWIAPDVLINRIANWQKENIDLCHADFQLAISRTYLKGSEQYIDKVKEEINGEESRLLCFLMDKKSKPLKPFDNIAHWWTASITKTPHVLYKEFDKFCYSQEPRAKHTGNYEWRVFSEERKSTRWDYKQRENVEYYYDQKYMRINLFPKENEKNLLAKVLNKSIQPKKGQENIVYADLEINGRHMADENDVKRFFSMVPNNPDKVLAVVMYHSIPYPQFWEEDAKRMFIKLLEEFVNHPLSYSRMGHLIIAGGMLCSDKTARALAGEIWIQGSQRGLADSKELGRCIGEFQKVEFAPLKRLTDLIEVSLLRISQQHNNNLQLILENAFVYMDDKPIKGLKKLLEIYLELLKLNKCNYNPALDNKFISWKSSKTVANAIKLVTSC